MMVQDTFSENHPHQILYESLLLIIKSSNEDQRKKRLKNYREQIEIIDKVRKE